MASLLERRSSTGRGNAAKRQQQSIDHSKSSQQPGDNNSDQQQSSEFTINIPESNNRANSTLNSATLPPQQRRDQETSAGNGLLGGAGGAGASPSSFAGFSSFNDVGKQWKRKWSKNDSLFGPLRFNTSSVKERLVSLHSLIPVRRRKPLYACVTILVLYLLFRSSSSPSRGSSRYTIGRDVLTGEGFTQGVVDRSTGRYKMGNKAKVLEGYSNPYGFISLVDPYAGGVFNPSILVLPDSVGVANRHLLVARGPEKYEVIEKEDVRWESVVGCFLVPLKRVNLNIPYLARETDLEVLKLPAERKMDFIRCQDPIYDQFIGPEDPRLFFTNDGQPLMVYSQTGRSPNICRAIFIIDARMVIPGLKEALAKGGWAPPIHFKEQTDLIREDQSNIEKNWSPFLGEKDELYFHVSLVPQRIYKYIPGLTLRATDPDPPKHNCLTELLGADMSVTKFHHATPLLRVTLCRRGECVPDAHNTVMFGMMHIKYHPLPYLFYERRVVTWNVTAPYEYLSVSKPLTFSGTNQADPIFTVSMAWDHPTKRHGLGLNHGFLDDVVITSFGVFDYGSAYIDVLARDMLTDHTMCAGVKGSSMW